ncbi:13434_t:CDS:2 [Ambispora leptoticha]|uniref:13434_t:CDS:1 n=1 Tax=Ambispora leptoticha TaxID=144679 RepID=A0A9N8ZJU1_9GLOM|nr:13434_t:CDS:2 [Ambispora leptoticha]
MQGALNIELDYLSTPPQPNELQHEQQSHDQHEGQQSNNLVDTFAITIPPPTYLSRDCIFNADADTLETSPPAYHTLFSIFYYPITGIVVNNNINPNNPLTSTMQHMIWCYCCRKRVPIRVKKDHFLIRFFAIFMLVIFFGPFFWIPLRHFHSTSIYCSKCQHWIRHFTKEDKIEQQRIQRQIREQQRQTLQQSQIRHNN